MSDHSGLTLMLKTMPKNLIFSVLIVTVGLVGCASSLGLQESPPVNTDLTGNWILDESKSQVVVLGAEGARREGSRAKPRQNRGQGERKEQKSESRSRDRQRPKAVATMVAAELKIEQDSTGLGIAFAKNPYRDIDWGEHKLRNLTVTAGWNEKNQLVVISKSQRLSFTETFSLSESGQELTIQFDIKGAAGSKQYVRVFTRDDDLELSNSR